MSPPNWENRPPRSEKTTQHGENKAKGSFVKRKWRLLLAGFFEYCVEPDQQRRLMAPAMLTDLLLSRLFRTQPNEIRFVVGHRRRLLDALMGAQIVRTNALHFARRSAAIARDRKRLARKGALMGPYKYVFFNGRVFVDCFYPGYPGKVFDKMVGCLVRNLARRPEEWEPATFALVLSITKKCVYRCEHCYAIKTLGSRDVLSLDQLRAIARGFAQLGIGVIAWEGGEPLLRFKELLTLIRENRHDTEALLATTAHGLTREKAEQLREAGLVSAIISLDHYDPDKHNAFRGNAKSFDMATNGVRLLREAGILPSVAICATRELVDEGGLHQYLELAKEIGVGFIQILDATPSGNYLGQDVMLKNSQLETIKRFHFEVNTRRRYRSYPSISARALLEAPSRYGCCAGNALCYVDSSGNLQACDLLQIAFGNVVEEGVEVPYRRMKKWFPHMLAGRCPAQTEYRRIADVYAKTESLPLCHEDCQHILERIGKRGPSLLAR